MFKMSDKATIDFLIVVFVVTGCVYHAGSTSYECRAGYDPKTKEKDFLQWRACRPTDRKITGCNCVSIEVEG